MTTCRDSVQVHSITAQLILAHSFSNCFGKKGKKDRLAFLPFTLFNFYIRLRNPSFFYKQEEVISFLSFFLSL